MIEDTSHALTPRSPEEVAGLEQLLLDSVPPWKKAYGGLDPIWILPIDHPFNLFGCFQRHDQRYDLARALLILDTSSSDTDDALWDDMMLCMKRDWPGYSKENLMATAEKCYWICRGYGMFWWPGRKT